MDDTPDSPAEESPAASRRGRHYRGRHRRLRHWPHRVLITANIVVLLLIASSATAVGYLTYEYKQIKHVAVKGLTPVGTTVPTTYVIRTIHNRKVSVKIDVKPKTITRGKLPFTVLIIGSDSRAGASKLGVNVGNTASQSENLSDAIILARVSPSTHQVALLSIPRDLYVNVPGMGDTKINAAFSGGDPSRLVEVIQQELGIPVNHYAALNFLAVEEIANAIGGVKQYFPTPAQDLYSNLTVTKAGCVNLTGAQALAFVRSRHYQYFLDGEWQDQNEPESDLGRIQRQQAFIRDGVEKVERTGALSDPLTLRRIISSVATNLTLDKTFSVGDLLSLADAFRHIDATKIPSVTLSAVNAVEDGSDVLLPSRATDAAEIKAFLAVGTTTVKKTTKPTTTTTTTTPKATSTTATTLPHGGISVEVENGSGTANQATTASDDLQQAGFVVSGSQDAPNFDYGANVVEYGSGGRPAAKTLRSALQGGATLSRVSSLAGADLILITGSSFAGITTSAGGGSTTTTTTVPTTTTTAPADGSPYQSATAVIPSSSSYVDNGVYIPPGRVSGQKVSTCGN